MCFHDHVAVSTVGHIKLQCTRLQQAGAVKVINNQVISSKTHSRANEKSSFRGECFNCGRRGHYAARCLDKQEVRINRIDATKLITFSGKISKEASSIMLKSGAAMSLFAAKLIEQKYYTCWWMKV